MMSLTNLTQSLRDSLSPKTVILTDPQHADFKSSLARWSDLDVKVPGSIIKPVNEQDILITVQEAIKSSVPFVPTSGGHSIWSTIDKDGFILDLGNYKNITVDSSTNTVKVSGGVLMKELQTALNKEGRMTTVGNGNTVGVIPYFLNGGTSVYSVLIGYACENIVAAKLITADGHVIQVSENQNPDLLWAIRGAGQFFGLVLELTIKTYPLSIIGNPEGIRQLGTYVFLPHQAENVCNVMAKIMSDSAQITAGHFTITCAPGTTQQILMAAPQLFGSASAMTSLFQPLVDLSPMQHMQTTSTFATHSDQLEFVCAKGEFKKFTQIGLDKFNIENFLKLMELHAGLLLECPGAVRSGFTLEWHSPTKTHGEEGVDTCFGMKDVTFWLNILSWWTDPKQTEQILQFDRDAQALMRKGVQEKDFVCHTNTTRTDPLEWRYKGEERVEKLKGLKRKWDPKGVFTRELL